MLHPRSIVRLAGLPAEIATGLNSGKTVALMAQIEQNRTVAEQAVIEACERLEAAYGGLFKRCEGTQIRRALTLKRNLFNLRTTDENTLAAVLPLLDQTCARLVQAAAGQISEWHRLSATYERTHAQELEHGRAALRRYFDLPNLRCALELNNPGLAARLAQFFAGQKKRIKNKDVDALYNALLNYSMRASQKVSPLSSLGLAAVCRWESVATTHSAPLRLMFPMSLRRMLVPRWAPLQRLFGPQLRDSKALRETVPVQLNPSLRIGAKQFEWTVIGFNESPADRVFGARHAMARTTASKGLRFLVSTIEAHGSDPISIGQLETILKRHLPERLQASARPLIRNALHQQLLVPVGLNASQVHPLAWVESICERLRPEKAAAIAEDLRELGESVDQLDSTSPAQRVQALRTMQGSFDAIVGKLDAPTSAADCQPLIHEDCFIDSAPIKLDPARLGPILNDAERLLKASWLLGDVSTYGATGFFISQRFLESFGPDGRCDDPQRFLMQVAQQWEERVASSLAASDSGALHPLAGQLTVIQDEFWTTLNARARDRQTITIEPGWLDGLIARLPDEIRRRTVSHCFNGQLVPASDGDRFVVNQIYPGNSRMLSRFLGHSQDDAAAVKRYLTQCSPDRLYAAIPGVFGFNANVHVCLADTELQIPPFQAGHAGTVQLPLSECHLKYDTHTAQVHLATSEGRRVSAYFLGILMTRRLPQPHRMLDALNDSSDGIASPGRMLARTFSEFGREILVVPRLFLGRLILGRKTFCVPARKIPETGVSDAEYFARLQQWRRELGLPRETFYVQEAVTPNAAASASRKVIKPMYLDFDCPLMIAAFRRHRLADDTVVNFSEALPCWTQTVTSIDSSGHVSELSFEMTLPGMVQ